MPSRYRNLNVQAGSIAREISMLAIACDINIEQDHLAQRILRGDSRVCGRNNPEAFRKLRRHLMAFFPLEEQAIERVGAATVNASLAEVRAEIRDLRRAGSAHETDD